MIDRELYRLHAKLPAYQTKKERALSIIKDALAIPGTWAVSCSGGKDSITMLHLCLEAGWTGPVFHFFYDETPAENIALVEQVAAKNGLKLHLLKVPGAWEVFEKVGRFFVHPETEQEKKLVSEMLREYKKQINEHVGSQGWTGQFMGLRRQESRARSIALGRKGWIYRTNDRETWTCCPLTHWNVRDVWAYVIEKNLPYLSRYENEPEKERSETTWLVAESLWRYGMAAKLKKDRPEEFARLTLRWPEIRQYV